MFVAFVLLVLCLFVPFYGFLVCFVFTFAVNTFPDDGIDGE